MTSTATTDLPPLFLDLPELGVAIRRVNRASLGVFATRDFKSYEPLFSESTRVVIKCPDGLESHEPAMMLAPVIRSQMKGTWAALLCPRAGVHVDVAENQVKVNEDGAKEAKMDPSEFARFVAKAHWNNFAVDGHRAMFALPSMFSHSCDPNVMRGFAWINKVMQILVESRIMLCTRRPVKAGEELTITYMNAKELDHKRAKRHEMLDFACDCRVCKDGEEKPPAFVEQSNEEERKALMASLKIDANAVLEKHGEALCKALDKEHKRVHKIQLGVVAGRRKAMQDLAAVCAKGAALMRAEGKEDASAKLEAIAAKMPKLN